MARTDPKCPQTKRAAFLRPSRQSILRDQGPHGLFQESTVRVQELPCLLIVQLATVASVRVSVSVNPTSMRLLAPSPEKLMFVVSFAVRSAVTPLNDVTLPEPEPTAALVTA